MNFEGESYIVSVYASIESPVPRVGRTESGPSCPNKCLEDMLNSFMNARLRTETLLDS
jgi:hypothetical protein